MNRSFIFFTLAGTFLLLGLTGCNEGNTVAGDTGANPATTSGAPSTQVGQILQTAALTDISGQPVDPQSLKGKVIGIYFSAGWCPPCREFTPHLVRLHQQNREQFTVIFVSSDRSPADQVAYMKDYNMDFLAVPHRGREAEALARYFGVRGIPFLAIVDAQGNVLESQGRAAVGTRGQEALNGWIQQVRGS